MPSTFASPKLMERLEELLCERFKDNDTDGLRRFVGSLDPGFARHLPGPDASLARVAHEAVVLLCRHDAISETLEQVLLLCSPPNITIDPSWQVFRRRHDYGSGTVYYLHNTESSRSEALKSWPIAEADDDATRRYIERNAEDLKRLHDPSLVEIYRVISKPNHVSILMEFVLDPILAHWQFARGRTLEAVLEVYISAGQALATLHKNGLLHRNFKPTTVFVARPLAADERPRIRLAGFGMQRDRDPYVGNPFFASPEHCDGRPLTARSDQFSFCVALHHALFSEHPYFVPGANTIRMADCWDDPPHPSNAQHDYFISELKGALASASLIVPRNIPPDLSQVYAILTRGLRREPGERHESMDSLLTLLSTELALRAQRVAPPARRPTTLTATLVLVPVLAAIAGFGWWRSNLPPAPDPLAPSLKDIAQLPQAGPPEATQRPRSRAGCHDRLTALRATLAISGAAKTIALDEIDNPDRCLVELREP